MCSSTQKLQRRHFHKYVLLVAFLLAFVSASCNAWFSQVLPSWAEWRVSWSEGLPFFYFLLKSLAQIILYFHIPLTQKYVLRKHQLVHHATLYRHSYCFIICYKLGNISKSGCKPNNHFGALFSESIVFS